VKSKSIKILAAITISSLIGLSGCNRGGDQAAASTEMPPAAVTTVAAITRDVPVYLDAIGKTVAIQNVSILPQVAGKIISSHVEDGASVKKGDLLFEIDPRPFEAAVATAKALLAQNKADLAWAQADFKRTEELLPSNVVSQLEYDQKKSVLDADQAKVEAAQAEIRTAELNLEYAQIHSPLDGRAGAVMVDPGNIVKANEGTIIVIQQLDPIYAEFTITENDLGTVRKFIANRGLDLGAEPEKGLKVLVDLPGDSVAVLAALSSAATQPTTQAAAKAHSGPREGTLTFLDNSVQNGSGTVRLRATLPNSDHYFWPGQFVNCRLVLTTKKDAVLVPVEAQQIGQQGPYVYVVGDDQTAQVRPITPGQRQGNLLVIDKGLQAGEQVIMTGQMMVMPGGKVSVVNPPPANPSAQARS
jgi:multidrug efflux system membrane fusion protein